VRVRAVVPVVLLLFTAGPSPVSVAGAQPPPSPPPVAFHSATLVREHRAIEVELMAVAEVGVTVVIFRNGRRLGRASATVHRDGAVVPVHIGPRGLRPLHQGLHVDVRIYYGPAEPLRAHPALRSNRSPRFPPAPRGSRPSWAAGFAPWANTRRGTWPSGPAFP
jgi:hypothetical protein